MELLAHLTLPLYAGRSAKIWACIFYFLLCNMSEQNREQFTFFDDSAVLKQSLLNCINWRDFKNDLVGQYRCSKSVAGFL